LQPRSSRPSTFCEVIGGEDRCGGDGDELVVGHGKAGAFEFALGFFEHVDVLGYAFCDGVVAKHFVGEAHEFAGVEAATVGVKMSEELLGGDSGVERAGMAEVAVPDFVDGVTDELGHCAFGGFVGGVVLFQDGMFLLPAGPYYCRCVVRDGGVRRWSGRDGERGSPCRCVRDGGFDDSD